MRRALSWITIPALGLWTAAARAAEPGAPVATLKELRETLDASARVFRGLKLEGVVCAVNAESGLVALQDGEGNAEILKVFAIPPGLKPGDGVTLSSELSTLTRGVHSLQIDSAPVVEVDGSHSPVARTGKIYLKQGMEPVRVEWFNGASDVTLRAEMAGQGMAPREISATNWFYEDGAAGWYASGLRYAAYEADGLYRLPDFSRLKPVKEGVASDLNLGLRSRADNSAMVFTGFLKVPATGIYELKLTSDDGGRILLGSSRVTWGSLPAERTPAVRAQPQGEDAGHWVNCAGQVTYAAEENGRLELELSDASGPVPVTLVAPGSLTPEVLIHERLKVSGVGRASGLTVIDPAQVEILPSLPQGDLTLTRAVDIRRLKPEDAEKPFRVELQGVVTMVNEFSLVLQDDSGGIFVHCSIGSSPDAPKVGDIWQIGGFTGSGDFSPVVHAQSVRFLHHGELPRAAHPTWEQLLSASLDAEQVEIEGVVVRAESGVLRLLTRDGVVTVSNDRLYPLPTMGMPAEKLARLNGCAVRLRGVYASSWDKAIGRVHPAELKLGSATLAVDEQAPADVFAVPAVKAADLLRFTSQSEALKRVQVEGVVLYAQPPVYFLTDGGQGVRVYDEREPGLQPGQTVAASGYARPGGPSPLLVEAQIKALATGSFPAAQTIAPESLPDARLDSTRVELAATLLSDSIRQNERALELTAGKNHFFAFLPPGQALTGKIERDSLLNLTGVYVAASAERALGNPDSFEIRLSRPDDLVILQHGPWWTGRHTIIVVSILTGTLVLAFAWVTALRRTVTRRSKELAKEIEDRETVERHRLMEQERARVAQDLHDELGSGLTEAGIISALLKNPAISPEAKAEYLKQLSDVCFSLVTGLDEIVWAVNPRYDSVADLAGYFSLFAQRFLDLAGIRCRMDIDHSIPALPLDSSKRHGIFLAVKEALNNIVRHSGAGEVQLAISVTGDQLQITLADDGRGFDPTVAIPGSDGVTGMERRMLELGGQCSVQSAPGAGSTVTFLMPLERNSPPSPSR